MFLPLRKQCFTFDRRKNQLVSKATGVLCVFCIVLLSACGSSKDSPGVDSPGVDNPTATSVVRSLDFSPFDSAIDALTLDTERLAVLDAMTASGDVKSLRAQIADGTVSARELTLVYLERIKRLDGGLRNVIELNPDALFEADRLDELQLGQASGRLHGIPILLKDNIATGDQMHNTAGAAVLAEHRAPRDSFVAEQLRAAGAVILGKTNLSEWANFMSSSAPSGYSALGGQVVNPFGAGLEVYGSSTGSAVAAGVRFAAATVGTETTGSIIAPAAANGVAGMRPTLGLVSGDLIIPIAAALDSAGPIARNVADLAELLSVMSARDDSDANVALAGDAHLTDFGAGLDAQSLSGLRVGVVLDGVDAQSPAGASFQSAINLMEQAGAVISVAQFDNEALQVLSSAQQDILFGSMPDDLAAYLGKAQAPIGSLDDVIAFNNTNLPVYAAYGQDQLVKARDYSITSEQLASVVTNSRTNALSAVQRMASAANDNAGVDVLVSIDNTFSLQYALAGLPAVTVPIGRDTVGQPHGASFVGLERGSDAPLLSIAYAFEQATQLREEPSLDAAK